jgi:hypothetical protein
MRAFKRNQVEEAISAVLEPRSLGLNPELRARLKRLLEADRALGRDPRSSIAERANYAFFGAEPPGTGVEVEFSGYDAFALLNGLRLMGHKWPQGFAVSIMRRVRPDLEKEHRRILGQDEKELFDQEAIRRNAKPGAMAVDNTDPVFLTIVSRSGANGEGDNFDCAIRQGVREAMAFHWKPRPHAGAFSMFELATAAHWLSKALARTEPRHRGRGASGQ